MSTNVEDQIVSMQFDNKQFESGVAKSLGTIDRLKGSLEFPDAGRGLAGINAAARGINLSPIEGSIGMVKKSWLGLTTVAVTAIGTITNKAVNAGLSLGKALTFDPVKAGFQNYEQQINAVKTILSNTAASGATLKDVTATLKDLNDYANLTVYNFADMAKNIGTFTAAGVGLKDATDSIKGIANLAALSGSSSEQASGAMYQLSQAIAAGQVHLQDWNSVVNAGIGGTVFQRALAQTGVAMGTLDKSSVKLTGSMKNVSINGAAFRQSLTPPPGGTSWLTSKVLTNTLAQFTGDLGKGKLAAEGFTKAQIKAIQAQAKMAVGAATQVKTFSQLTQALKEEVASAWANVFKAIFGNIKQATKFFTGLHNVLQNLLTNPINDFATMLEQFRKLGGFESVWNGLANVFKIIANLTAPIRQLFAIILPSSNKSASGAVKMANGFEKVTGWLVKATDGLNHMRLPMRFVADILRILGGYVKIVASEFKKLAPVFDVVGSGIKGLQEQFSGVGTQILAGISSGLVNGQAQFKQNIENLGNNIITWIKDVLGIHSPASTMVPVGINIIQGIVSGLTAGAQFLIGALQKLFIGLGKTMKYLVENISWSDVVHGINEGLFIALALTFRNFIKSFTGTIGEFKELIGKAGGVLGQLTSNLKTMQQKVKSEIIRNIAISVGILAASAFLLSKVNGKKLAISLGAIAGMMTSLLGVMYALGSGGSKGKHVDSKGVAKQTASLLGMSTALIAFSTSVLILTTAVALMGQLKVETIKKGLAGIAGVIGLMVTTTAILSKTGGGATILATATAMLIMSAALTAFVGVMKLYESLDWKTLVRGGGAAAAVILAIGLAMRGFGKGAIGGATGLIIASAALVILAKAMQMLSSIGLGDMVKSVIALDLILASLTAAANAMSTAEGGAGSMLIMAGAIVVLAIALKILSKIPILGLIKAIGALVVSLALIAGAAIVLAPAVPLIAALGTAVLLLGGAVLLAGLGILAFATAMGILAVVGPAAFQAIHDGIGQLLEVLPKVGEALGEMVVSFFTGIVEAAGPLTKALGKLLGILIDALTNMIPKGRKLMQKLINAMIDVFLNSEEHAARATIHFLLHILKAIDNALPKFIKRGTDIIVNLITGLAAADVRIANATGRAILHFLRGLDKAVTKYEEPIIHEGELIALHIGQGIVKGLGGDAVWGMVKSAVEALANKMPHWMQKVLGIASPSKVMRDDVGKWAALGVADGLNIHSKSVESSSRNLAENSVNAMRLAFENSKKKTDGLLDLRPKITPILDLTQLEKDATGISAKMGAHAIKADISRRNARNIASDQASKHRHNDDKSVGDEYNFYQTINSPKPVNHVKAYRGTKSQIALFKEVTSK